MTKRSLDQLDEQEVAELMDLVKEAEEKGKIMCESFLELEQKYKQRRELRGAAAEKKVENATNKAAG